MSNREEINCNKPVIGRRPDGSAIVSPDDLPFLPVPKKVVIGDGVMQIDEWFFSLRRVSRKFLHWFKERLDMWMHLDPSDANREWIKGVLDAFCEELTKSNS